jgi:hypothetical protein
MPIPSVINSIFQLLPRMVEIIDDYGAKNLLKNTHPETITKFSQFYGDFEKSDRIADGITAFKKIKSYVVQIITQYNNNLKLDDVKVQEDTKHAMRVANFVNDLCTDMCDMLQNTPQNQHKTFCSMIEEELATYTPISYDNVRGMEMRLKATHTKLKDGGRLGALLAELKALSFHL